MIKEHTPSELLFKAIGNWNPRIFNPNWITNNLLGKKIDEKVNIGLLFNLAEQDYGYEISGIKLFPRLNELSVVINNAVDFSGVHSFFYDSIQTLSVNRNSIVSFNNGITFAIGINSVLSKDRILYFLYLKHHQKQSRLQLCR